MEEAGRTPLLKKNLAPLFNNPSNDKIKRRSKDYEKELHYERLREKK
jgi:hypothetical protein